jgi:tetratricopeptide (TPR) repeat protein
MAGDWSEEYVDFATESIGKRYNEEAINYYLRLGKINSAATCLFFYVIIATEQGYFRAAQELEDKLSQMADQYDADYPRALRYILHTRLLLKFRRLKEALIEFEAGIPFANNTLHETVIVLYAGKAQAQVMLGEIQGAEKSLRSAREILSKIETIVIPWYSARFSIAQLTFDLHLWEGSQISDPALAVTRKRAREAVRNLVRNTRKVAPERIEAYRAIGTYFWFSGRQGKARKWWSRSIAEGERLHARLDLARSYLEVGKRLLEPKSKYRELDGIQAEEYLEKARSLFEELDLQWDLLELEMVTTANVRA